ncbi:LOW QUALITY PROTEIN: phosphatidylinositol-glycan biosynthesis class F protein-like [Molossus nigricans]
MSRFVFHVIFVLYGAPLIELVLEIFLFAGILSTFTTIPCLCLLGPNIKALRVFSRNGVWPISCTLGATCDYLASLAISSLWIYWNRKQLAYKNNELEHRKSFCADSIKTVQKCTWSKPGSTIYGTVFYVVT